MTKYYIFRHGQTLNSKFHLPYPKNNKSVEILPEGIPALERMAKYLKNIKSNYNFSSEYLRCQQSTAIVTKISGLKFKNDKRLNEKSGENFDDFKTRVKDFVEEVEKKNYEIVVICTHGAVIAALKGQLLKGSFSKIDLAFYPRPGVLLCIKDKVVEKIDFR